MLKVPKEVRKYAWPIVSILVIATIAASFLLPEWAMMLKPWIAVLTFVFILLLGFNAKLAPKNATWLLIVGILLSVVAFGVWGINPFGSIEEQQFLKPIAEVLKGLAGGLAGGLIAVSIIGVARHELQ